MAIRPSTGEWDAAAIRRAMRVLCAHPPQTRDAQATARALRIVWDILKRRGAQADVYQVPGIMPLIVVGHGPILIVTYLDDQSPISTEDHEKIPSVADDLATGSGVTRRAGLLSAIGTVAGGSLSESDVTLVIEADRHLGSQALQSWLSASERPMAVAMWEATDLPVESPAIFQSATGVLTVKVTVAVDARDVESLYAGVVPDPGHQLVEALASLKSRDSEVLIPGFYDGIETPDTHGLESLASISDSVHTWVSRGVSKTLGNPQLSPSHVTLGAFCAPSILVRSIEIPDASPFVPRRAESIIEARLMPGQDAHAVAMETTAYIKRLLPSATVEALLVRQPYEGSLLERLKIKPGTSVYPTAPGDSPAGILGTHGIPSIGFATVARVPELETETVRISSIEDSTTFIADLARRVSSATGNLM